MTVRNVRNHRARGLIGPPALVGRTGYYGAEHLERLKLIRAMQAEGFNLEAIRCLLGGSGGAPPPIEAERPRAPLRGLARRRPPRGDRAARGRRAVRPGARAMTLPDPHAQLRTLRESLAMAARPADEQLALLPGGAAGPARAHPRGRRPPRAGPARRGAARRRGVPAPGRLRPPPRADARGRRAVDRRGAARRPALGGEPRARRRRARGALNGTAPGGGGSRRPLRDAVRIRPPFPA